LALKNFGNVFSTDPPETKKDGMEEQNLYTQIGHLKVEKDWLKKVAMISTEELKGMIGPSCSQLSLSTECQSLSVSKSSFDHTPTGEPGENLAIMCKIDKQYFKTPFYGALRLTVMEIFP
jgi:putative transposase